MFVERLGNLAQTDFRSSLELTSALCSSITMHLLTYSLLSKDEVRRLHLRRLIRVVSIIIDHHVDLNVIDLPSDQKHIDMVGSCATLIASRFYSISRCDVHKTT